MKIAILVLAIGIGDYAVAAPKATCAIFEVNSGNPINDAQSGYNAEPYQPLSLRTTDNFFTSRITRQDDEIHGIAVNLKADTVSTAAFSPTL